MPDLAKLEANIEAINRIVSKIHPLGSIIISGIGLLIKVARKSRVPIGNFEQEFLQFQTEWVALGAATQEFRNLFGTKENPKTPGEPTTTTGG